MPKAIEVAVNSISVSGVEDVPTPNRIKPASLQMNFVWTLAGNVVFSACQWAIVILLAKLGSAEMVGQYSLGLAVVLPIKLLTSLSLRGVLATDVKRDFRFSDYLGLRISSGIAFLILVLATAVFSKFPLQTGMLVLLIALSQMSEAVSELYYGYLQRQDMMVRIAKSMVMMGTLSLLFTGALLAFSGDVVWAVTGLFIGRVVILFAYDSRAKTRTGGDRTHVGEALSLRLKDCWDWKAQMRLAWFTLPLGVLLMFNALIGNLPRYSIEHFLGLRELGIFSAVATLMALGGTIVEALGQATAPRLATLHSIGNTRGFNILLGKLLGVGLLMGGSAIVIASVAGKQVLSLLYRPEYGEQVNVLVWLMVVMTVQSLVSFLGIGMTAARYFKSQMIFSGAGAVVSLVASYLLIPIYGLSGAAYALLLVAIAQFCGRLAALALAQGKAT